MRLENVAVAELVAISKAMRTQVPAAAHRVIADCEQEEFKQYLEHSVPTLEALIMFHASCVYTKTDKQRDMQRMLLAQLQQLVVGFVLEVIQPKSFGDTAKYVARMKVDDSLTLFSEHVVQEAQTIAATTATLLSTPH